MAPDRLWRSLALIGGGGLLVWLVWYFSELALFLLIGFVIAYILAPVVDWFQQFGMPRFGSVLVTFVLLLGLFMFLMAVLIPFAGAQTTDLAALVTPERIVAVSTSIEEALRQFIPVPENTISTGLERAFEALFAQERITGTFGYMVDLFTNILYALILIPFTTFFFMKDGPRFKSYLLAYVPNRYFEITLDLIDKVETNLGAYFRAISVRAVLVGVVASVLLSFAGLNYAVMVGAFTGIVNTIPYFGPVLGFMAGTIVGIAQTGDLSLVLGIFLVMAVVQGLDNAVFQPWLFSRVADAHPLVVLCAVLIGAELAGILGMLLSVPVLTIARVTTKQITWSLRNYFIFRPA